MIGLVLAMIGARRAQAVTVLLLCVFATGAAVAGPVALAAVDRAVVAHELAEATPAQRTVTLTTSGIPGTSSQLESPAVTLLKIPGFKTVFSAQHQVLGIGSNLGVLAYRDQVCEHVTLVHGRCFQSLYEVVLGEDTARRHGIATGDTVRLAYARWNDLIKIWEPADPPANLTVVGVYRPVDPREPYWGRGIYFNAASDGTVNEPVLADRLTLNTVYFDVQSQLLDQIALPGTLTVDSLGPVRDKLTEVTQTLAGEGGGPDTVQPPSTDLPELLDRIDRNRTLAARMVPVAFVPLVALCWFVIYLAVSYGVFGRRHELGMVALRGVRPVRRWWLGGGETVLAILLGAPIGYLVGHFAVRAGAAWRLGSTDGTAITVDTLPYALGALAGALIAAQLGQRAEARRPVADLLHRVPGRGLGWRSAAFEALLVVFAVLAVVQLRASDAAPTGVTMLVPGLAMAAVAFVAARAVIPVAAALARGSLRRGRLGSGLAAVQLARRPGSQRLLVLVTMAVAMLCFVVAAIEVGDAARRDRAAVDSGASTVVTVRPVPPRVLLAATERADPDGAYAMAVANYPGRANTGTLAVDSRRLAAVAEWRPDFGVDPARLAGELRPAAPASFVAKGARIAVTVTSVRSADEKGPVQVGVWLAPLSGIGPGFVAFGDVPPGRSTLTADVPQCVDGCRLSGVSVSPEVGRSAEMILHEVRTEQPAGVVVSAADFSRSRWLAGATTRFGPDGDGLSLISSNTGTSYARSAAPLDLPERLPVVATGDLGGGYYVTLPDRGDREAEQIARANRLPRLGTDGILVDLDYLDRAATRSDPPTAAEVWLGPAAPADAVRRLTDAGLTVLSVVRASDDAARLDREGPAMALWFHLVAAVFALVLALAGMWLVATVDRRRRAEDLRALRWQGLSRRAVRRATLWGQLSVVLAGTVLGLIAAAVAWLAAGDKLPVDADLTAAAVGWPTPSAVLWPWLAALGILITVALIAAIDLRRAVARGPPRHLGIAGLLGIDRGTSMTGLAVACRRVVHIYRAEAGDVVALAGVDLSIAPGEMVALVGPSGSGKSTLIALLSGLMRPSAGRVNIGTYDIGRLSDAEMSRLRGTEVGVVLQGAARNLLPYASLERNIWLAQTRAAGTKGVKLDDPERILDLVGLGGQGRSKLAQLAPGARQRAALAVGIAAGPGLLLVDEPTSQLDAAGRDEVVQALETVNAERGTTIVVVTHDGEVGAKLGRAVTIRDGRVGAEGRDGQDFAVVAGDGTVQLPPDVLGEFPPGTLFTVDRQNGSVSLVASGDHGVPAAHATDAADGVPD